MNKLIVLWSHPRSMSTATERVMRERGDLWCAHEPFMYDYYVHRGVARMPHFDVRPDHPVRYEDIRDMLVEKAASEPVFFKDMAYYVMPSILSDPDFIHRLTHVFLIRYPVASILSYHKLDPDLTLEEIGIEAQWRLYEALREMGVDTAVIEAEAVQHDTRAVMAALWQRIGLPFRAQAFDWQDTTPKDWQQVGSWHDAASSSSGIRPIDPKEIARKKQEFEVLCQKVPHLAEYLAHHMPYYQRLKEVALPT
ncbi:hypothetical protein [uncultured Roseovarius sp.]|uniref:sulfotransferase-like domain-containing protein n=1 Tax=uncultured Roseovarius sp. TaxID=293344 RepID=UPI002614AE05|nr:hypothetical protein [uncultured Roseovarius sp.]